MAKTQININTKVNSKPKHQPYQGANKIYYVYHDGDSTPCYSGTLAMCQKYMDETYRNVSLDHRSYRKEFK